MTDGAITGDGTSLLAKAQNWPETYEEFKALAESNGIPLDLIFNSAGWQQLPTFLNKANLLTDSTVKQLFQSVSEKTVDQAIARANELGKWNIGDIRTSIKSSLGSNWLLCNGATIDKSAYPDLAPLLGSGNPLLSAKTVNIKSVMPSSPAPNRVPSALWVSGSKFVAVYQTTNQAVFYVCTSSTSNGTSWSCQTLDLSSELSGVNTAVYPFGTDILILTTNRINDNVYSLVTVAVGDSTVKAKKLYSEFGPSTGHANSYALTVSPSYNYITFEAYNSSTQRSGIAILNKSLTKVASIENIAQSEMINMCEVKTGYWAGYRYYNSNLTMHYYQGTYPTSISNFKQAGSLGPVGGSVRYVFNPLDNYYYYDIYVNGYNHITYRSSALSSIGSKIGNANWGVGAFLTGWGIFFKAASSGADWIASESPYSTQDTHASISGLAMINSAVNNSQGNVAILSCSDGTFRSVSPVVSLPVITVDNARAFIKAKEGL